MLRRGSTGSRAEVFAVQSDIEEESAIETVLTNAEEQGPITDAEDHESILILEVLTHPEGEWEAISPEPRRPQSRRSKSKTAPKVLRQSHQRRRTRDDVPWHHHEKHRPTRDPVGMSEIIERRLAKKKKMKMNPGLVIYPFRRVLPLEHALEAARSATNR